MGKQIEVEVRGILSPEQEEMLKSFLKSKGQFKEMKKRVLIDYSLFLPDGGIRNRSKDIRLRVTNGKPEIIVKVGEWGANEMRQEISVLTAPGTFDSLVQIFGIIGLTKGALCIRNSEVYDYEGIEFSIVEVPNHSKYFEAEKVVPDGIDSQKIHQEIKKFCQELGLKPFDKESFMRYLEVLNKEANTTFDFSDYIDGDFQEKYNL